MISIEIADITIRFSEIMKEEFDSLMEFLQDNKIHFEIIEGVKNKWKDY